jgi:hypothetical protein
MSRPSNLFILNITLLALFILQVILGIRLWFVELLNWGDSELFMNLHLIIGFGLIVLIAAHVHENRNWIKAQIN